MKRCICGQSSSFPICDGQHSSQGWTCKWQQPSVGRCILAGQHYFSLAEKLAAHLGGMCAHNADEPIRCSELIVLSDGTDIEYIRSALSTITHRRLQLICIGIPLEVIARAVPQYSTGCSIDSHFPTLWLECLRAVTTMKRATKNVYTSVFVSHSVDDEQFLLPVVTYVRQHFNINVFLCTDSILSGANWFNTIVEQLDRADNVIAINSKSFYSSTFCSFEIGRARGANKNLSLITLDNSPLPAYVQDLQCSYVNRHQRNNPWLTHFEAFCELFLQELCF